MLDRPYIGITDFPSADIVDDLLVVFDNAFYEWNRVVDVPMMMSLGVGVMMSRKTLDGLPTKWAKVFPAKQRVAKIFASEDSRAFHTLHYADFDDSACLPENELDCLDHLLRATAWGGPNLKALQLDMVWPRVGVLEAYRDLFPQIKTILQIGRQAMEQVGLDPAALVKQLQEYHPTLDAVLLDMSMGEGRPMDARAFAPFIRELKAHCPQLSIGVAGGLGPDTLHLVAPLIKEFSDLSIDAQGQLRASHSSLDPIDWNMAYRYLVGAIDMFVKYRK